MKSCYYKWPSDLWMVKEDFQKHFGLSIIDYIDNVLSWVTGRCVLDIIRFDDLIHNRHGNYEELGMSLNDLIVENYGEESVLFLEKLI